MTGAARPGAGHRDHMIGGGHGPASLYHKTKQQKQQQQLKHIYIYIVNKSTITNKQTNITTISALNFDRSYELFRFLRTFTIFSLFFFFFLFCFFFWLAIVTGYGDFTETFMETFMEGDLVETSWRPHEYFANVFVLVLLVTGHWDRL